MDLDLDSILDLALVEGKEASKNSTPASFLSRRWTKEEENYIRDHIGRLTYDELGVELERSQNAIHIRQVRKGLPSPSKRPGWLTGHKAAQALGVDIHTIMLLVKSGSLPVEIIYPETRRIMNIRIVTLYRWATRPENWIHFKVEKMKDKHLQSLVIKAKVRWGDRWVSTGAAERILGVGDGDGHLINRRIHLGRIPEARKNGNWFIPLSVVERLHGTIGSGKGGNNKLACLNSREVTRADQWMMKARGMGWTHQRIAASMKNQRWNTKTVGYRLLNLKKFEEEGQS